MLYPIPAAAARLGISRSRIYIELSAGRLRAVKAGRRTLIAGEELSRWIAALPVATFGQKEAANV